MNFQNGDPKPKMSQSEKIRDIIAARAAMEFRDGMYGSYYRFFLRFGLFISRVLSSAKRSVSIRKDLGLSRFHTSRFHFECTCISKKMKSNLEVQSIIMWFPLTLLGAPRRKLSIT